MFLDNEFDNMREDEEINATNHEQYNQAVYEQQEDLSASSILALFDTNAAQRQAFALSCLDSVESGVKDVKLIELMFKNIEDINDRLHDVKKFPVTAMPFRKYLLEECKKYGSLFEFRNAKFNVKGSGGKADYSKCNDLELEKLQLDFDNAKEALEERQKFLKNLPVKGFEIVDKESGELKSIYQPAMPKGEILAITLKR